MKSKQILVLLLDLYCDAAIVLFFHEIFQLGHTVEQL